MGSVSMVCGVVFTGVALIMLLFPPRKINDLYGYRTNSSKKSQQRWDFAQRFSAWRMMEAGVFLALVSIGLDYAPISEAAGVVIELTLPIAVCFYMFFRTESAIKKKFPH